MFKEKINRRLKKIVIITAACTMMSMYGAPISSTEAAIRSHAPSVYVTPQNTAASDIISIDWSPVQTAPYTYWAVHNWNQGGEGGGYAGFQQQSGFDQTGKRTLHFALWDPIASNQAIKAEYLSPTSEASRFGGEGTGLKVQTTYNWKDSEWYRMTLRSWQEDGHTKFGQWIKDNKLNQWKLVAIMDHPVANVAFNYGLSMFQEDWAGNGQDVREARLKNGYSRKVSDQQWNSWNNQRISGQHDTSYQYDGGATSEYLWVKAGGNTQSTIGNGKSFNIIQPSQPEMGILDFDIQNIRFEDEKLNVSWKLKEQSAPQFKGKIEIYNNEKLMGQPLKVIDNIKSYQTEVSQTMQLPQTAFAKITLTDIFDRTVEKKVGITNGNSDILVGNQFAWSLKGYSDREIAKVDYNKAAEELKIKLEAGVPHSYFNSTYASIKVQNSSGNVLYNKEILGNRQQNTESQTVSVKVGDYIELTHIEGDAVKEKTRATLTNLENNKNETIGKTARYLVTKEGLKKVEKMPETTILDGQQFAWSLKGYSDREIAKVDYNKTAEELKIKLEAGVPHSYFNSTYASIKVQGSSGSVMYNKEIMGNRQQNAETQTVPIKVGDYIELTHIEGEAAKEKSRATLTNLENGKQEYIGKKRTYQVTSTGLIRK
ncbi:MULTISPECIES: putative mucin/carbohydrate-binding domain-containing protein [Bacillus]|uniref:Chitin-binding protein n=1 Tax=Bacillus anthracis TaxID=1392 RepID=A0A2A7D744_BACAN|nr:MULTISPECIES: putative mucin/carbohydrate-binding domain-containing protein [Bacillus]MDC7973314.1 putative mucin/carbohydrate-binding domain-containing protein [Bacillus sp. BLCC-B18]PDZ15822.1 chitin-binding protein [Bacillus anthracis]PDZ52460.1 chitin-binding protein [Bacillus sp. AFS094611]